MALILADRVKESTTTTGTSDFALGGAITGFQTFAAAVGANNTTYYAIADGADYEVGLGTLSGDGLTLARTTVLQSSNADAKVVFAAGAKHLFVTYPADKAVFEDSTGNVTLPASLTVAGGSTTDSVQLDLSAGVSPAVGQIAWDANQGTASLGLLGGNIISRLGQSLVAYVTNAEAVTITKGQAVYLFSAQGDRATVKLANNTGDATSAKTLGIVGENIDANGTGFIVCQGVAYGLNLSAFTAGDTLYLGATAGAVTATKPYAPNHLVYIGMVEKANAGAGQLYVRVQNGYELDELHNVSAQSPTTGQTIVWNSSTNLWEKNTVSLTVGVNGTLPVANGGTGVTTSTGTTNVVLSNSPTLVTPTLGVATATSLQGIIGNVTPAAGSFTTVDASGAVTLSVGTVNGVTFLNGSKVLTSGSAFTFDGTTPTSSNAIGAASFIFNSNANTPYIRFDQSSAAKLIIGASAVVAGGAGYDFYGVAGIGLTFHTNASRRLDITSAGDVGIGTSSPLEKLDVTGNIQTTGTSGWVADGNTAFVYFGDSNNRIGGVRGSDMGFYTDYAAMELSAGGGVSSSSATHLIKFITGTSERARISSDGTFRVKGAGTAGSTDAFQVAGTAPADAARITSNGNYLLGTPTDVSTVRLNVLSSSADSTAYIRNSNATPYGINIKYTGATPNNTGSEFLYLEDSTALRMSVRSNGGIANYAANNVILSDRREKTNFAPAKSYLETICAIPVQTFNYIDQNMEEDGGLTLGVVAQDVQAVAPELVMESNWASKDEEPKMRLSIYQTDLQYALMKCIQEQQALITSLTARITALESN